MFNSLNGSRSTRGFTLGADGLGHLPRGRVKPMTEVMHHPDTGCSYSPSCLNCHLPQCVHDMNIDQEAKHQKAYDEWRMRKGR